MPGSLERGISPPTLVRRRNERVTLFQDEDYNPTMDFDSGRITEVKNLSSYPETSKQEEDSIKFIPSPIQLTRIRDLGPECNVDTVGIEDILKDPLLKECWQFNFLFDIPFLMAALDEDVRSTVAIKIVHGFWKREDERRINLEQQAREYTNVSLIPAYMPEPFGTHHSKMMVLIRHDDSAQVVIHTANIIPQDWRNMTQALWRSPLLPLLPSKLFNTHSNLNLNDGLGSCEEERSDIPFNPELHPFGSSIRFKHDLLSYLSAYGSRLKSLVTQLAHYDFSAIKAALVASTPCKQPVQPRDPRKAAWGWIGLREVLSAIPAPRSQQNDRHIVIQVSSIATLGQTDKWLKGFMGVLSTTSPNFTDSMTSDGKQSPGPTFSLVFPTPDEIRGSLDGYAAGGSIHVKIQTQAQRRQLEYLRPLLRRWGSAPTSTASLTHFTTSTTFNPTTAPHVKTYICFSDPECTGIEWALISSANLSTQAWGSGPGTSTGKKKGGKAGKEDEVNGDGETVRICSWEVGVVVWPGLFGGEEQPENREQRQREDTIMVPIFGRDMPTFSDLASNGNGNRKTVVGFRMPYDIPLVPYTRDEIPWCATMSYEERDWRGRVWGGYQ
ncbi:phospholipase D/nuclease [Patellaria atrata CBS 101060]|uniref:Phospholipase D/nuclease n=1 Tax=Patellaria atrata CBS 101060 TaxID=1346257 RepID=A0A9P4VNB1_9PEZI|nr:phospholipase D/nuclease [Patellaria atrata CBS 101060]